MDRARRLLLWAIAAVGSVSVALQLYLNLTRHPEHSLAWRLIDFVSYFTNTTGILATAVAVLALLRPSSKLAQPGVVTATATYILVVTVTYELLLRGDAHGLYFISNTGLHEVLPVLVLLLWIVFTPKGGLTWRQPLAWLAYPAAYVLWTLARGAAIHRYPYFFADVGKLGYPRALANGAGFLAVFYGLGLGAVALGRIKSLAHAEGRRSEPLAEHVVHPSKSRGLEKSAAPNAT